jgi:anaphase-promoting complex subunit 8
MTDMDTYQMSKAYFDLKEYDRAAFFTQPDKVKTDRVRFLHYYSKFLSGEKKKLDDTTDSISTFDNSQLEHLRNLREEMEKLHRQDVRKCC